MEQSAQDEAAKQRIIKHMNSDHQDSLVRYLEYFCQVSSFSARNAKLDSVALDSLSISTSKSKAYLVPIQPAMETWSEARTRFADLDAQAVAGLKRSNITVKSYARPTGFMAIVFISCCLTYLSFSRRANFQPRSLLYDIFLHRAARFADFCYKVQPLVIYPMVVGHLIEAIWMARSRLRKHSVPTFSWLWWTWFLSTFIEGKGAFIRIDRIVEEERVKKASAKH
ncbi:MAG: hypothetical protein Q9170_004376 [Blastenia crenularia]